MIGERFRRRRAWRGRRYDRRHDLQHARPRAGARRGRPGRSRLRVPCARRRSAPGQARAHRRRCRRANAAAAPSADDAPADRATDFRRADARSIGCLCAVRTDALRLLRQSRLEPSAADNLAADSANGPSWNALPAGSYCCGVGGARWRRSWPARWRCWRRRPTISSRSASSPFRSWSGCSTAPPAERPARFAAPPACRPSRSAGGSASAISSPACGGSAAPCWSRPTSFAWALPIAVVGLPAILARLLRPGGRAGAAVLDRRHRPHRRACRSASRCSSGCARFLFTGFPWNPVGYARDADAAADAVGLGRRHGRHERACGVRVRHAGACLPASAHAASAWRSPLLLVAAHVGFGYCRLGRADAAAGPQPVPSASSSRRSIRRESSTRRRATRSSARCSTCRPRRSPPGGRSRS